MDQEHKSKDKLLQETILIVDDDESVRRALVWTLNSDYRVLEASSRKEAVKLLQNLSGHQVRGLVRLPSA